LLSICVVFLWIYETQFLFIYLVYILAFVGAVLMLFLSVVLMLPISATPVSIRPFLLIFSLDNHSRPVYLRPPGLESTASDLSSIVAELCAFFAVVWFIIFLLL
jgi:hypothetical protein